MTTTETTGIHVTPAVSEEEMSKLSLLFSRAANAIIKETELAKQVHTLEVEMNGLRHDVESSKNHSTALDEALLDMRRQRDEAISRALQAERERDHALSMVNDLNHTISQLKTENAELEDSLSHARKDRDDFGFKNIELEAEVKVWKDKAEKARANIDNMMNLFRQPEPVAPPPEEAMQEGQSVPLPTDGSTPTPASGEGGSTSSPDEVPSAQPGGWWSQSQH